MQIASLRHDLAAAQAAGVKLGDATACAIKTFTLFGQYENALRSQIEIEMRDPELGVIFRALAEGLRRFPPGIRASVRPLDEAAE